METVLGDPEYCMKACEVLTFSLRGYPVVHFSLSHTQFEAEVDEGHTRVPRALIDLWMKAIFAAISTEDRPPVCVQRSDLTIGCRPPPYWMNNNDDNNNDLTIGCRPPPYWMNNNDDNNNDLTIGCRPPPYWMNNNDDNNNDLTIGCRPPPY